MFTGLVKEIAIINGIKKNSNGVLLTIKSKKLIKDINIDDSISINGVCQSAISVDRSNEIFCVQAIKSTLEKTNFLNLKKGDEVNLELALRLSDRLGGHMVSGHVNNIGKVKKIKKIGESKFIDIIFPKELEKYIVKEGSITINGVSLTICSKAFNYFTLALIPHTMKTTNLVNLRIGSIVNIEVDMLAKYLENIIKYTEKENNSSLSLGRIKELGF